MQRLKLKNKNGFTIIEVMIVLAIAGLIMLIVFLAVPALQRASRNNARKSDASRLASAVSDYVSNNDGSLPCTGAANDASTIFSSAGTLANYNFSTKKCGTFDNAQGQFIIVTNPAGISWGNGPAGDSEVFVLEGYTCSTTNVQTTPAVPGNNSRQAALVYDIEQTGTATGYAWNCIQAV